MSGKIELPSAPPKSIKPQEWEMYNPVWMDCSVEKFPYKPIRNNDDFRYLWVIKPTDRLILGIEFDDLTTLKAVLTQYGFRKWLETQSDSDLNNLLKMGHPTLSAEFKYGVGKLMPEDKESMMGTPTIEYGQANYGGELNYRSPVGWRINNSSGRHSGGKTDPATGDKLNAEQWTQLLLAAKILFKRQLNLEVGIDPPKIK